MFSLLGRNTAKTEPEEVDGSDWDRDGSSDPSASADALERGTIVDPCSSGPVCRQCSEDAPQHGRQQQPDHEEEIYFRPLREIDREAVKALHEEWFPVRYKEDFYDNVVRNRLAGSGDPLFSCVACVGSGGPNVSRRLESGASADEMDDEEQWNMVAQSLGINFDTDVEDVAGCMERGINGDDSVHIQRLDEEFVDDERGAKLGASSQEVPGAFREKMVGCIVGAFLDTNRCNKKSAELLVPDPERYGKMFYIMTLGTTKEYRNRGLATELVEKFIQVVEREPRCGVLYLHVITYNEAAIRFYEKLNFYRVEEIEDYYNIDDKHYNCYLYARYFHGNRGHLTFYYVITNLIGALWRRVSAALKSESV